MRILTLNANLKGIGTYGRCYYFSRELARRGHDVTMATVSRSAKYRPRVYYKRGFLAQSPQPVGAGPWVRMVEGPSLGYKWLPGWGSGPLDIWWRIRELWSGNYDALYGFEYQPDVGWPFYLTRHLRSYRFVSDWCDWYAGHSNHLRGCKLAHRIDGFFEEHIRSYAQTVTVISRELYRRASDIGVATNRIVHVPQGVDTELYRDHPKQEVRRRLGLPAGRPIALAVMEGDMCRTVRIIQLTLERIPNAIFIIMGTVPQAPYALAEALGISPSIHWTGWVDKEYDQYIGCADVCFLPLTEGIANRARFPTKLLDYLASGRPVVTNAVGEVGDLLRTREVGLMAGQADGEIADSIATLLKDPHRARDLGLAARQVMVEEWDWKLRGDAIAGAVEHAA